MCFPRKATLGRYAGTRSEWRLAYRNARIAARCGDEADCKLAGLAWKATLIVFNERDGVDDLTISAPVKLDNKRLIDEILAEARQGK